MAVFQIVGGLRNVTLCAVNVNNNLTPTQPLMNKKSSFYGNLIIGYYSDDNNAFGHQHTKRKKGDTCLHTVVPRWQSQCCPPSLASEAVPALALEFPSPELLARLHLSSLQVHEVAHEDGLH